MCKMCIECSETHLEGELELQGNFKKSRILHIFARAASILQQNPTRRRLQEQKNSEIYPDIPG